MKKVEKKTKTESGKNNVYSQDEMGRYLGAINEQNNENYKAIKEGFQILNHRLDDHDEKFDSMDKRFDSIDKKLDSHSEMIGVLMEDTSILKEDMRIVKKELRKKVDYDEFLSLVRRVQKIEAKI